MATKKRSTTMNRGADDERAAILRNAVRCFDAVDYDDADVGDLRLAFEKHIAFIRSRKERTKKREGGLGHK